MSDSEKITVKVDTREVDQATKALCDLASILKLLNSMGVDIKITGLEMPGSILQAKPDNAEPSP